MAVDPEALAKHQRLIAEKIKSEFSGREAKTSKLSPAVNAANRPFSLSTFSISGQSKMMKEKLLNDQYVLKDLALLGEFTALYSQPNAGKTLLVLWQLIESIRSGIISGDSVFYINADDNFSGLTLKTVLAETYGFHMLSPGHKGFDAKSLIGYLKQMIASETSRGAVIILDTLKKFTSLMDKSIASEFMTRSRAFITNGGTIIALGHVNKHRSADGKLIFAGTTDIIEDGDCVFLLDTLSETGSTRTVLFENIKMRGNVSRELAFSYSIVDAASYHQRLDSVRRISAEDINAAKNGLEADAQLKHDQYAIAAISEAVNAGHTVKGELVKYVQQETAISRRTIIAVLDRYQGVRWVHTKKPHGAKIFALMSPQATEQEYREAKMGKFH